MRRNYISPEYYNNNVNGALNVLEESNYFSAKMLDIEEEIIIDNIDIIWYQNQLNEQLDYSIESTIPPSFYSPSVGKFNNLSLRINPTFKKAKNTKWLFDIDLKEILTDYLFAILKKYRTFEGIKNEATIYNDIDIFIREYIKNNILNRYQYKNIDLYIQHRGIEEEGQLKYKNNWNINLTPETLVSNYQSELSSDSSKIKLSFLQYDSNEYIFDYFYNIHFERI